MDDLIDLIISTNRLIRMRMSEQRDDGGCPFTHVQLAVLRYLRSAGSPTMKDIAAHLRVTAPSATGIVNGMVREGLVERHRDQKDRRTSRIKVTTKGRKALTRGYEDLRRRVREILSTLEESDRKRLRIVFERLARNYNEH